MAVDPNTGQSVINIPGFDQKYAQFIDPSQIGQLAAQQGQVSQQGKLAQALMNRPYVQNSGWAGSLAMGLQAMAGMKMLKDSQSQMASVYQQQLAAAQKAAQAAHTQKLQDDQVAVQNAITQATGIHAGEGNYDLSVGPQKNKLEADKAAQVAQATFPTQMKLEDEKGKFTLGAAQIGAEATKGRAYSVSDGNGNTTLVAPQPGGGFLPVYSATSPGGGKLTPPQVAANDVDTNTAKQLSVRNAGAQQLPGNAAQWVAAYTGQDPKALQGKSFGDLATIIRQTPTLTAVGNALPMQRAALDSIGKDLAVNVGTMKRGSVTEAITDAETQNGLSPTKTPEANARILLNYGSDYDGLQKDLGDINSRIAARQSPGNGRVPQADPGPTNPSPVADPQAAPVAPSVTHVWTPDGGLQQVGQ